MTADDITILADDNMSDDPIFTLKVMTPIGTLSVMGIFEFGNRSLEIEGMHIGGDVEIKWGWSKLRLIGRLIAEKIDVDEIVVIGAVRTTGANPGSAPRLWRITRASQPEVTARLTP